jgi:hypothetical protein
MYVATSQLSSSIKGKHMAKAPIKSVPAVTLAAGKAGAVMARWNAVELAAQAVHESDTGRKLVQAPAGKDGIHALVRDQHGVTMEIAGGKIAVTIAATE